MRKHETDINIGSNTFAQPIDIDPNNKNRIQFFKKTIKNMKMFHVNKKSILQKSHDITHIQDVVTNKPYFYKDLNYYIQTCHNNME